MFLFGAGYGGGGGGLTVTGSAFPAYGSKNGIGTVVSSPFYVYVQGGSPPYTYSWEYTGGDAFDVLPSGNSVRFSFFMDLYPDIKNGTYEVTVTDVNGATGTLTVPVMLETKYTGGIIP